MQSVLGGQALDVMLISAPDLKLWTGHANMHYQDPFYHGNIYSQEKAHKNVGLFIPRLAGIVAWPGFGLSTISVVFHLKVQIL
jgi:hypothetical protein